MGPVWVWLAFKRICDRFKPCCFSTLAATWSAIPRGIPTTSTDTMTIRSLREVSNARALAHSGVSTPSDGCVRAAYPDIQIGPAGVISTIATPAFKEAPESPAAQSKITNAIFIGTPVIYTYTNRGRRAPEGVEMNPQVTRRGFLAASQVAGAALGIAET